MKLSESSGAGSCSIDDVLITDELARRPSRPPDYAAENEALVKLARELATDAGSMLQKVAELALHLCRADSAGVSVLERDGGEEIFRWRAVAGSFTPNLWGTLPRAASPCGTVITRNSVMLFNEAARFFPALRSVEPRIYENLLVPWEVGGKVMGTIWAIGHSPEHRFDAEDARLLGSLARFAGAAYDFLERTRAAEGLRAERLAALNLMEDAILARRETEQAAARRESEETYRALFESIDEGFCTVEVLFDENEKPVDYRFLQVNPSFERQTGISNMVGRRMREVTPGYEELFLEIYGRVALTGESVRFEHHAAQLGRWYDVYAFRVGAPQLRRVGILFKDISERKRAEESQRRVAELDAFRVALTDALRPLTDPLEIQRAATRLIGERLSVDCVLYAEIGDDGETITVADNYVRDGRPKIIGRFSASNYGTASETLRAGQTFVVTDVGRGEGLPVAERRALLALGYASIIAVPLVKNGRWLFNLGVYHSEPRVWTPDEIRLLEEAAERTWAAVERARAEEALRQSERRMQRVLETDAVGVIFFDHAGTVVDANHVFLEMTGYTRADVESGELSWWRMTPPEWMAESEAQIKKMETTGRIGPYEKEYILRDGSRKWMLFAGRDLGDGTISEYCMDITARKELEAALRRAHNELEERVRDRTLELAEANVSLQEEVRERRAAEERVKGLLAQLVTVQEEERRRIARELHDTLGQQLTALRLSIDILKSKPGGDGWREEAERMQAIFDRLNSDVDFLAWELRPAALDMLGLDAALRDFVREWSEHFRIAADYHGFGNDAPRLAPEVETNLYRILQEALQNVHKHAGATHVSVQLERRDGQVVLVVEDNGRGYDPDAEVEAGSNKGMGVVNMRERAALVGGELEIESAPNAGTTIYVRVPWAAPTE
jgi:PAS domain S-box-containing protein